MAAPKRRLPARTFIPPELIPTYLENCQQAFKAGDVWKAWEACFLATKYRHHGLPMPEWVLVYLEQAAGAMTSLSLDPTPPPPGPPLDAAIARALGLKTKGAGALTRRRRQAEKMAAWATDVVLLLTAHNSAEDWAIRCVAKLHKVGPTVVHEAYKAATTRGDRLDGRRTGIFTRDLVKTQQFHPGSRIDGASYTGEPFRRTWIIEALSRGPGATVQALLRLEPPPLPGESIY